MTGQRTGMGEEAYTLVFGLTADPIHKGHEQVILNSFTFAKQHGLNINKFILVPTYQPNLIANKAQPRTHYAHRLAMCELVATQINKTHENKVHVSDIEKQIYLQHSDDMGFKSYSYATLKALKPNNRLFVLSADHFAGRWPKFRKWHMWQELLEENGLLIHQRPGHKINRSFVQHLKTINPNIHVVQNLHYIDTSSTQIRSDLRNNQAGWMDHLSTQIAQYISLNKLYQVQS